MGIAADTTLRIEPTLTLPVPIPTGSEEPTRVLTESLVPEGSGTGSALESPRAQPSGNGNVRRGSALLLGASLLGIVVLIWAAMAREPATVATDTSLASAGVTSIVATTGTSTATTNPPTTTSTSTTVPTTLAATPETITAAIYRALDGLRPPVFHPRDVNRLEGSLRDVTENWKDGQGDLEKPLEKFFERIAELPDTEERDQITSMAIQLAESMGVRVEQGDTDEND
jgi:hypothetical protein